MQESDRYEQTVYKSLNRFLGYSFVSIIGMLSILAILITTGEMSHPDYESSSCNKEMWMVVPYFMGFVNVIVILIQLLTFQNRQSKIIAAVSVVWLVGLALPFFLIDYVPPETPGTCL
ncbi:hypothetical protein Q4610_15960 [Sphingobium sp. HBC34]|uniref:DUF805 domain-containing protein n=1 Tax=Sphingobium cyanobacteriorum TaxID=3063954 RepID=A0ABT8ZQQ9_9SPHN|nr:hypothetical protein [Sphingobium sp. HBC34]MDO7836542.1 hypothetical protein [Sphingobium sp. HBC34]